MGHAADAAGQATKWTQSSMSVARWCQDETRAGEERGKLGLLRISDHLCWLLLQIAGPQETCSLLSPRHVSRSSFKDCGCVRSNSASLQRVRRGAYPDI